MPDDDGAIVPPDDPATDVQDIGDPQLLQVADTAFRRQPRADAGGPGSLQLEGSQHRRRRVLEALEGVRHREVIDIVDLPAVHRPPVRLDPLPHAARFYAVSASAS